MTQIKIALEMKMVSPKQKTTKSASINIFLFYSHLEVRENFSFEIVTVNKLFLWLRYYFFQYSLFEVCFSVANNLWWYSYSSLTRKRRTNFALVVLKRLCFNFRCDYICNSCTYRKYLVLIYYDDLHIKLLKEMRFSLSFGGLLVAGVGFVFCVITTLFLKTIEN